MIAVLAMVGLPAMYVWSGYWLGTSVPALIWGPVSFVLIGFTAAGSLILYRFVRDRADPQSDHLDERQRQLRDQAYVQSYGVLSTVVVAVIAIPAVLVLGFGRTVMLDPTIVTAVALVVGTLIPVLPFAMLAWLEPDVLGDE
ncbi:MAG TPA: hypothetical protein VES36_04640 [Candidatus Limnocylindrales bacterium]|nr:hypothetical protein [Candidatus Limnocylindrales bacterium]